MASRIPIGMYLIFPFIALLIYAVPFTQGREVRPCFNGMMRDALGFESGHSPGENLQVTNQAPVQHANMLDSL